MTKQATEATPKPVVPMGEDERKFSDELAKRYPDRFIKGFVFPSTIREARKVFIMEIDGKEEVEAAAMADATMSAKERASNELSGQAEKREAVRLAIVGLGIPQGGKAAVPGAPLVYRHVNNDGIPFVEINHWPAKAWACLYAFNGQMNGVPMDELMEGIEGARTVGAFAPPPTTSETPEGNLPAK